MKLETLLAQKKDLILNKWFARVMETYPEDASNFFKQKSNKFSNPVGSNIFCGLKALIENLFQGMDNKTLTPFLDPIIRIRAVQDFSPSEALSFIFSLKTVIREVLEKEILEKDVANELLLFESKIDALALMAFNIYVGCKEKLYQIKTNEVKNQMFKTFERANLITKVPAEKPDFNAS